MIHNNTDSQTFSEKQDIKSTKWQKNYEMVLNWQDAIVLLLSIQQLMGLANKRYRISDALL